MTTPAAEALRPSPARVADLAQEKARTGVSWPPVPEGAIRLKKLSMQRDESFPVWNREISTLQVKADAPSPDELYGGAQGKFTGRMYFDPATRVIWVYVKGISKQPDATVCVPVERTRCFEPA